MSLCLVSGIATAMLAAQAFTLSWADTVERIERQESWTIEAGKLELLATRMRGGANMPVPVGAHLAGNWYHFWPNRPPIARLVLARSAATSDYLLCWDGGCRSLVQLIAAEGLESPVEILPCPPTR